MTRLSTLWAAIVAGLLSTFVIPATAWAAESGVADLAAKRPKIGGFGIFGALCCLVVVGVIVLVVFLIMKNKKR
jgi:hypothetical protein